MTAFNPLLSISWVSALSAFLWFCPIARAGPAVTVFNPLENQLPTVARINKYWSWAPSPDTFHSTDGDVKYTTTPLPDWMDFDSAKFVFAGTPSEEDEDVPEITVTAKGSSSSASSRVSFCISKHPSPIPKLPLAAQFRATNPSLSSVFRLSPGSSLTTGNPILRIPSGWSFSIGFEHKTITTVAGHGVIYYGVKQANGSKLPEWMDFNRRTLTLNGVVPSVNKLATPKTFHLELHGSDQEACSATSMPFDIVIASHEVSVTSPMPTINVTAAGPFNVTLDSPADFTGIFVDGKPIQTQSISDLAIEVSDHGDWLHYDPTGRTLNGSPRPEMVGKGPTLPVKVQTIFNQSVNTNVSMAIIPSYFTQEVLPTIYAAPGNSFSFNITGYFSNSSLETRDDVALSLTYEPLSIGSWFEVSSRLLLNGTVPGGYPAANVSIMFTANSGITHSTSRASLPIHVVSPGTAPGKRGNSQSNARRAQFVLVLAIILAVLGGICFICGVLALQKKARKTDDLMYGTANNICGGERGTRYWLEGGKSSNWEKLSGRFGRTGSQTLTPTADRPREHSEDLGLRRVQERSGNLDRDAKYGFSSSAQCLSTMNKRDFFTSLRQTVRQAHEKCSMKQMRLPGFGNSREGPVPAREKPGVDEEVLPFEPPGTNYQFCGPASSGCGSSLPSSSWAESTFGYSTSSRQEGPVPEIQAPIHSDQEQPGLRLVSKTQMQSKDLTFIPEDLLSAGIVLPAPINPWSGSLARTKPETDIIFGSEHVTSQKAGIVKRPGLFESADNIKQINSEDELKTGLHYVQALGADNGQEATASSAASTHTGTSLSSAGSRWNPSHGRRPGHLNTKRVVVMPGREFKFSVPIQPASTAVRVQGIDALTHHEYSVRIISGRTLLRLHVDLNEAETRGVAEVTGEATKEDIGVVAFGIYAGLSDEVCLAMVIIEVGEMQ